MAEKRKPDPIRVCGEMRLPSGSERFSRLLTDGSDFPAPLRPTLFFDRSGEAYPPQNPGGKFPIKLSSSPLFFLLLLLVVEPFTQQGLGCSPLLPVPFESQMTQTSVASGLNESRREPYTSLPTHCVLHVRPAAHSLRSPSSK